MPRWRAVLVCAALLAACAVSDRTVVPDSQMSLEVANGTTIEVTLVVTGIEIRRIPANTSIEVTATDLPALPWSAEVLSPSGRALVALVVRSGDVHVSANGRGGVAERVDLSCGRIDIWSGPPMAGPMPGPGVPGDCD